MGTGKTWLLKGLARTGPEEVKYVDLDRAILQRSGHNTILKMMKELGELHFRRIENEVLIHLMKLGGHFIALGGGALNKELNQALRKREDILVVWIDTPLEQCLANLQKDHKNVRPLAKLGEEYVRELYQKRREIYSVAKVRIDHKKLRQYRAYPQFIAEVERQLTATPKRPEETDLRP